MSKAPVVLAYGGGTNSTALLVGMHERGERPDLSLFADTGGERPETYEHVRRVSEWCVSIGFPPIITVQQVNKFGHLITLEGECLKKNSLPSLAYGYKKCSQKYKRFPQDKYINNWEPAREAWKAGMKLVKLIGYDADEERRAKIASDDKYDFRYPLIEWEWGREECVEAISRAGLPQPGKSACFFCPSSTKEEILRLQSEHPEVVARAG